MQFFLSTTNLKKNFIYLLTIIKNFSIVIHDKFYSCNMIITFYKKNYISRGHRVLNLI